MGRWRYNFGPDHPLKLERAAKTYELCMRYGLMDQPWMTILKPDATDVLPLLTLFHEPAYLSLLEETRKGIASLQMLERGLGTLDNPILSGICEWTVCAARGTNMAMQQLVNDETKPKFYIEEAYKMAEGNKSKAALLLNINHHTFRYRRKKLQT